jgi:hypothetical protein
VLAYEKKRTTSVLLNEFNMQGHRKDMRNIPAWQRCDVLLSASATSAAGAK